MYFLLPKGQEALRQTVVKLAGLSGEELETRVAELTAVVERNLNDNLEGAVYLNTKGRAGETDQALLGTPYKFSALPEHIGYDKQNC